MGRTPVNSANRTVSSESAGVPDALPWIVLAPLMSCSGVTSMGSNAAAILDCTARGDIVLDSFLGSGTTLIAAERTGRICYGLEIEPHYVDVIIRRWQTLTGKNAIHATSKKKFTALEQEAASV